MNVAEDINIVQASITGVMAAAMAVFGFFGKRFIDRVDALAKAQEQHEKDDLGKYATVDQLQRVHERIDASVRSAEDNFRELRNGISDIKTILINGASK